MPEKNNANKRSVIKTDFILIFVTVLLISLGLLSFYIIGTVNQASTEIEINWLPSTHILGIIKTNTIEYRLSEMEHVLSLQEDEMNRYESRIDSILTALNKNRVHYEKIISSPEEQQLYQRFSRHWDRYLSVSHQSMSLSKKNLNHEALALLRTSSNSLYIEMGKTLNELIELNVGSAIKSSHSGDKMTNTFTTTLVIILSLGGMALFLFIYDVFKKLRK